KEIIKCTHAGANIYAHILRIYYPNEIVLEQSGRRCKPAKNPFNEDKRTLDIYEKDGVFCFQDTDLYNLNGSPLDFAALHYKMKGQDLMKRIVEEMHLPSTDPNAKNNKGRLMSFETGAIIPTFSYFRAPISNIHPHAEIAVVDAFRVIKGERYKARTAELRSLTDPKEKRKHKASKFDYVTFAGVFNKRADNSLLKASGLLTLDLDHVDNVLELKQSLIIDPFLKVELLFVSPSGTGLKCIIAINLEKYPFIKWFEGASGYIRRTYHQEVDPSGKDLSRACFLPHDPDVYMNPDYLNATFV
ncbi:MAG TPA: BT4734/BF3469 family protein, partial [Prolixibacteraceae bacterium]|nr:BT4734/BF3469 family protein [Prolixibacteraceae bacterium]